MLTSGIRSPRYGFGTTDNAANSADLLSRIEKEVVPLGMN
jgi:hypothetical protein